MYGIFTYIYTENYPNVDKYGIHWASGHSTFFSAAYFEHLYFQVHLVYDVFHGTKGIYSVY